MKDSQRTLKLSELTSPQVPQSGKIKLLKLDQNIQMIDSILTMKSLLFSERTNIRTYNVSGVETIEVKSERTVEVPVMDIRTKGLIHLFARSLRSLSAKYPKILLELDSRVTEFFQQEIIDVIEVDEIDRIVEIVKFVPQTVRVDAFVDEWAGLDTGWIPLASASNLIEPGLALCSCALG